MYRIGLAAIVLVAISGGRAEAGSLDVRDLYRKAEALVQSMFVRPADREIIKPPGNIDPRMALAPPPGGRMRSIEPPARPRQQ